MNSLTLYKQFFVMSVRFIANNRWASLTSVLAIALVVMVLVGFLSMAKGFESAMSNSGADHIGIAIAGDARAEISSVITREELDILTSIVNKTYGTKQPVSPELVTIVSGTLKSTAKKVNISLRGVTEVAPQLHEGFRLTRGRMFTPGTAELVVGEALANRLEGFIVGNEVKLGGINWRIVGTFKLKGNLFENEVWGSLATVQSDFSRQNQFQSVRLPVSNEDILFELYMLMAEERRLDINLQTEKEYFLNQSSNTVGIIKYVGWPLALILSIGAFCGTFNNLKIALDSRRKDLKVISLLGFQRSMIFQMLLLESVLFAALGSGIGIAVSYFIFDGVLTSTVGGNYDTVSYALNVDYHTAIQAFLLALGVGFISGVVPAYSATKTIKA